MCGFFGLLNLKGNISQNDIREIKKGTECIRYRGPDDHNEYYDNNFIVSFNRLSILDVKAPSQPLVSEDKNFILVCNGEIYNYQELKNELKKKILF